MCRDCEMEISEILLTIDLRVIDMSGDYVFSHLITIACTRDSV